MALPSINDLKMWVGTLFTKDDWDYNFSQIVSWLADGNSDIVVNSVKATNGIDLDGAQIINVGAAETGSQAVNLDQALTILNRTSYYSPFSVAAGKIDSDGNAAYIQKDSDTQVTVLAGNVNPDLVCISSDGTVESVTSNTVLTIPVTNGTYHIIKEKGESITITTGSANKVTIGKKFPSSQNTGDYFLDNSVVPFVGYKYGISGWEETPFCYLGYVKVTSGTATVTQFKYNDNYFDLNVSNTQFVTSSLSIGSGTTDLTDYLPKDGAVYNVWVYNNITGSSSSPVTTTVSTDIFPTTYIATTDGDDGRDSANRTLVVVPVGVGRTINVTQSCTIKGYMRA